MGQRVSGLRRTFVLLYGIRTGLGAATERCGVGEGGRAVHESRRAAVRI